MWTEIFTSPCCYKPWGHLCGQWLTSFLFFQTAASVHDKLWILGVTSHSALPAHAAIRQAKHSCLYALLPQFVRRSVPLRQHKMKWSLILSRPLSGRSCFHSHYLHYVGWRACVWAWTGLIDYSAEGFRQQEAYQLPWKPMSAPYLQEHLRGRAQIWRAVHAGHHLSVVENYQSRGKQLQHHPSNGPERCIGAAGSLYLVPEHLNFCRVIELCTLQNVPN